MDSPKNPQELDVDGGVIAASSDTRLEPKLIYAEAS